jgi:hypothetical protein
MFSLTSAIRTSRSFALYASEDMGSILADRNYQHDARISVIFDLIKRASELA